MAYLIVGAVLVFVVPILWALFFGDDGLYSWFLSGVLMWCLTAVLGVVLWVVTVTAGTTHHSYEVKLRSLGADSSIEGRSYFLGGGYVGEKRVLNYIGENGDGSVQLFQADASDSRIFEDSDQASLTVKYSHTEMDWLVPFKSDWDFKYEFHIPEGSVLSDYTIDNGGS